MLKNFGLQVAKAGMDHAAFMAHWIHVHAPLSAPVSGVRGYAINEILARLDVPGAAGALAVEPAIDGIAQLWWDSREAMAAASATAEAQRWFSDGANYLGARTGIATTERAVLAPPAGRQRAPAKLIRLLAGASGQDTAQFTAQWRGTYAEAVLRVPGVVAYVQSTVRAVTPASNMAAVQLGSVAGIDEIWFESAAAARTVAARLPAMDGSSCCWLARDTVIIAPPAPPV